jgi:hypothetical protein
VTALVPAAGWIGLVKIDGFVGEAIRIAQWLNGDGFKDYEHAFVMVDGQTLVEAEPGGVRTAVLTEYQGREVLWIPCPPQYAAAMVSAALAYVKIPYSYTDYVAIAAHHLDLDPLHLAQLAVSKSGHVICSQMAAACAAKAGWPLIPDHEWPGYITPAKLTRWAPSPPVPQLVA